MIHFKCPTCEATLKVPEKAAGKPGKCPKCGAGLTVPSASSDADAVREMLPDAWYFQVMGETFGPMSFAELRRSADAGLPPDSLVKNGDDGEWFLADRIEGLFSAPRPSPTKRATATKACPFCGAQILPTAMTCRDCRKYYEQDAAAQGSLTTNSQDNLRVPVVLQRTSIAKPSSDDYSLAVALSAAPLHVIYAAIVLLLIVASIAANYLGCFEEANVVSRYLDAPDSVRPVVNVVTKLIGKTEMGISYVDYCQAVGEVWGEVKVFSESHEGKALDEFSFLLRAAVLEHKRAKDIWTRKLDMDDALLESLCDSCIQGFWQASESRLRVAELLISHDKHAVEEGLSKVPVLRREERTLEDLLRKLDSASVAVRSDDPASLEQRLRTIREALRSFPRVGAYFR